MDAGQLRPIVQAQAAAQDRISTAAAAVAGQAAHGFGAWYESAAIGAWARQLLTIIQALQRQSANLTNAYLSRLASSLTGRPMQPVSTVDVTGLRTGADPVQVYGRAADTYRYAVSRGKSDTDALAQAVQRAQVTAQTDVALAMRAQAQKFMVVHRVDGFRRVIHPELAKGGTCGLCVAASNNVYHRDELLPLHARCNCTVAPIINGVDPGHQLNREDLDALYKMAGGSTKRQDLTKVRFAVHHNSEVGHVLAAHGQHWRGPAEAADALDRAS